MDGVQQDFIIAQRPLGESELRVELDAEGGAAEPLTNGARLVLEASGREIAYGRVRVTDATGREFPARIEVLSAGEEVASFRIKRTNDVLEKAKLLTSSARGSTMLASALAILVKDEGAVYPLRIDPTFSDANWVSMGSLPGANSAVSAAVVDVSGNLYVGGYFTVAGNVVANGVAKWNGSSWTPLGSGMNSNVSALAVSGDELYAAGAFTTAGGVAANYIAKWNGINWAALGSGMNDRVLAVAVSGSKIGRASCRERV